MLYISLSCLGKLQKRQNRYTPGNKRGCIGLMHKNPAIPHLKSISRSLAALITSAKYPTSPRDAWSAQHGLSRTEAKCNYIATLIETMHKYASTTPESRELVAELEFVWDQIKPTYTSSALSSSSIPQRYSSALPITQLQRQQQQQKQHRPRIQTSSAGVETERRIENIGSRVEELQILSPTGLDHGLSSEDEELLPSVMRRKSIELEDPIIIPQNTPASDPRTRKWRRKIEHTLVKMTTEIAALRESLDIVKGTPRGGRAWILLYTLSLLGSFLRHLIIDALAISLLVLWVGRGDERVISSLRTLAQVLRERFQKLLEWKGVRKRS